MGADPQDKTHPWLNAGNWYLCLLWEFYDLMLGDTQIDSSAVQIILWQL